MNSCSRDVSSIRIAASRHRAEINEAMRQRSHIIVQFDDWKPSDDLKSPASGPRVATPCLDDCQFRDIEIKAIAPLPPLACDSLVSRGNKIATGARSQVTDNRRFNVRTWLHAEGKSYWSIILIAYAAGMPELPEVEHLRRTLRPWLIGARITNVDLRRRDVVRSGARNLKQELLAGTTITKLHRHGKNLGIVGANGRVLCVHLGMSGQLRVVEHDDPFLKADHVHCLWKLQTRRGERWLAFRDPRRFGGLWPFDSVDSLKAKRWSSLGPDALRITPAVLAQRLGERHRPIKAALLDQSLVAGVGNIYADEALFLAGIHPRMSVHRLDDARRAELAHSITNVLRAAIRCGGSTIRSYVDGAGRNGSFVEHHMVYGRAGQVCIRCGGPLRDAIVAQRTTVYCPNCQSNSRRGSGPRMGAPA